jgi:hypothetical protein
MYSFCTVWYNDLETSRLNHIMQPSMKRHLTLLSCEIGINIPSKSAVGRVALEMVRNCLMIRRQHQDEDSVVNDCVALISMDKYSFYQLDFGLYSDG